MCRGHKETVELVHAMKEKEQLDKTFDYLMIQAPHGLIALSAAKR